MFSQSWYVRHKTSQRQLIPLECFSFLGQLQHLSLLQSWGTFKKTKTLKMKIFNQSFATGPKAKWWFYNTLTLKWMPVNQLGFFGIGINLHLHFCPTLSLKFPNTCFKHLMNFRRFIAYWGTPCFNRTPLLPKIEQF